MDKKLYKLMNWPKIEAIIYSEEDNPHELLGPHSINYIVKNPVASNTCVQAFYPDAVAMDLILPETGAEHSMQMVDEAGYYAVLLSEKITKPYKLRVRFHSGAVIERYDAYCFEPQINKKDTDLFNLGLHYHIYDYLGAHPKTINGVEGVLFAVWAPNAIRISVVGDFNQWDGRIHQMRRLWTSGIFEIFIPGLQTGEIYKFELKIKGGLTYLKSDPYGYGAQYRPENASVIRKIDQFQWTDHEWIQKRKKVQNIEKPISVYEVHLGSFAKPLDGREFFNYRELAIMISDYVKEMGYTHIEIMPVMEHPYDASWGYQTIGYYAPTARHGTPDDFMYFMNYMHESEIGVILDWVPAHFPRDIHGLSGFDGTCLYEHQDPRQGYHPHWGTLIFNYGRPEVSNYLLANALFWVEKYHVDGIRIDAVASMLYLDYGKQGGEWIPNIYGSNENLEAIEFLKHLNSIFHKVGNGAICIAEESTAYPMVTGQLNDGALGFDYKWNMGWMNDFLTYMKYDPFFRSYHHTELTFSMIYQYSEKFMLVFSHDEVVHGKASMVSKMPGSIEEKFMNLRLAYGFLFMHPGKKLLFMGQDIGEFEEWSEKRGIQWDLVNYESHKGLQDFVRSLNHFYQLHPALFEYDHAVEGFEWINCISDKQCVISFMRKTRQQNETLIVICNFANVLYKNYTIGVPYEGSYKEILNSNDKKYGGNGGTNLRSKHSVPEPSDDLLQSIKINVSPLSISVFEFKGLAISKGTDKTKKEIAKKQKPQKGK